MAGSFSKPRFKYDYKLKTEKNNFDAFFTDADRAIPAKRSNEIDVATWNIANLGVQKRRAKDLELIAYILSSFDIIAIQEIRSQLDDFQEIMSHLVWARTGRFTSLFEEAPELFSGNVS